MLYRCNDCGGPLETGGGQDWPPHITSGSQWLKLSPRSMEGRLRRLLNRLGFRSRKTYCIFNKTRESFVSLNVAVADTHLTRLFGLLGRVRLRSDEGLWVIPSYGIHTIGLPFAVDLIYLDYKNRVVGLVESLGGFRVGPIRLRCASVLELANHAIYSSQTQVGDELLICSSDDMQTFLAGNQSGQTEPTSA